MQDPDPKTIPTTDHEIADTIVGEVFDHLALADRRMLWIDMHEAQASPDSGVIEWPKAPYNVEPTTETLDMLIKRWAGLRTAIDPETVESLFAMLARLRHTIEQYGVATDPDDRAYFAFSIGKARNELTDISRDLVRHLRKELAL